MDDWKKPRPCYACGTLVLPQGPDPTHLLHMTDEQQQCLKEAIEVACWEGMLGDIGQDNMRAIGFTDDDWIMEQFYGKTKGGSQ